MFFYTINNAKTYVSVYLLIKNYLSYFLSLYYELRNYILGQLVE